MIYLLMIVKLTLEFLVGSLWKSTRHLYNPTSSLVTCRIKRWAGVAWALKKARDPSKSESHQCFGSPPDEVRSSYLNWKKDGWKSLSHELERIHCLFLENKIVFESSDFSQPLTIMRDYGPLIGLLNENLKGSRPRAQSTTEKLLLSSL